MLSALKCTGTCNQYPCACYSPQQRKENIAERSADALERIAAAVETIARGTTTTEGDTPAHPDPEHYEET
jgi:hypothetical protein